MLNETEIRTRNTKEHQAGLIEEINTSLQNGIKTKQTEKKWLIRISGEENLFYDSAEKVYRLRMRCPLCNKVSNCQCYDDLDDALSDIADDKNYVCSYRHAVLLMKDNPQVIDAAHELGAKNIHKISNKLAEQVLNILWENGGYDDDSAPMGETCKI